MSVHHWSEVWDSEYDSNDPDDPTTMGRRAEIPWGYSLVDLGQGTRPEDGLVWSEDELRVRFMCDPSKGGKQITCGYCRSRTRSRAVDTLVEWFHEHECAPLDATTGDDWADLDREADRIFSGGQFDGLCRDHLDGGADVIELQKVGERPGLADA